MLSDSSTKWTNQKLALDWAIGVFASATAVLLHTSSSPTCRHVGEVQWPVGELH